MADTPVASTAAHPAAPRSSLRSLDDALADLLSYALPPLAVETVSTFDADGRILADDAISALQVPPHDNSAMDGYAMRASDVSCEGTVLRVSQRIPAGSIGMTRRGK